MTKSLRTAPLRPSRWVTAGLLAALPPHRYLPLGSRMAGEFPRLPQLRKNASGKTKPKAIAKANPVTPAERNYPWGGPAIKTKKGVSGG
jgi:hypothetical protein